MQPDINQYIFKKWPNNAYEVIAIVNEWDAKAKGLLDDRLIRSVLFISTYDLESIRWNIEEARIDYRDVFLSAEYDKKKNRIRDFTKSFHENQLL